jgi:hypothetical protein
MPPLTVSRPQSLTVFNQRLVTLSSGQAGLRGGLQVDVREPSPSSPDTRPSSPVLDFIASTGALDRYDEIIEPGGWRLENYRRNPVFQNAHQYGDIIFTLGRALVTEVRSGDSFAPHLFQRVEFATDVNPMAKVAYGLYKGKFLNAVSVGFLPLRWEDADGTESERGLYCPSGRTPQQATSGEEALFATPEAEREFRPGSPPSVSTRSLKSATPVAGEARCGLESPRSGRFRRRYLEQELLEVSAVGIPANPEALQLALKAGAIQKPDLKDLLKLLRQTVDESPRRECEEGATQTKLCSAGTRHPTPVTLQLLRFARVVREILRKA